MSVLRSPLLALLAACAGLPAEPASSAPLRSAPAAARPDLAKRAACERVWTQQRLRHGSRATFVAACIAKG